MASIITDVASLKAWMNAGSSASLSSDLDTPLQEVIDATQLAFEAFMRRPIEYKARVEVIKRVRRFQKRIHLVAAPVSVVTLVEYASDGDFSAASTVSASTYYVADAEGVLWRRDGDSWEQGLGVYRVTYTAGMGTDMASFASAYPDIQHAAHLQCAYEWQRKRTPGSTTSSGRGGTKTFEGQLSLLKRVQELIGPYRRLRL